MVDSHHQSAPQTDQGDGRLEGSAVGPEVHDSDLGLRGAVGSLDDGFEGNSLLEKVEMTIGGRDGVEVGVGGGELNSLAREGVERLEEKLIALMGQAFGVAVVKPVVEKDGFGDGGVIEMGARIC